MIARTAPRRPHLAALALALLLTGCNTPGSTALQSYHVERQAALAEQVRVGRDEQVAAREQFQATLTTFRRVTAFQGGALEQAYADLGGELQRCEERARSVTACSASLEALAARLFDEWQRETETETETLPAARQKSALLLADARERYSRVRLATEKVDAAMAPVLAVLRDQVTFLEHNLNPSAIAALQDKLATLEPKLGSLLTDIEASIAAADTFIRNGS